jgi:hypothetical protein
LGIRKATKNASEAMPVPKNAAITISLMNPNRREQSVTKLIIEADFRIDLLSDIF